MKKILSLVMVVAMLVAVLALVGCNDTNKPADTTAGTTTAGTTTAGTTTAGTTTAGTTTAGTTTADTTVADTTTAETTTLPPVYARFDFGTASKAEELGMTKHDYLVSILTIDTNFISVDYTEDTMIVKAVQSHPEMIFAADTGAEDPGDRYAKNSYALCYENIVSWDFADELTKNENFMKVRIKNNTTNNIMSIEWHKGSNDYATTMLASCMYFQGGAPTVDDYVAGNNKLTCDASEEFKTYTYDINFLAALGRHGDRKEVQGNSYVHMAYYVGLGHGTGSNNWNWMGTNACSSIQFLVLGAYGGRPTSGRLHSGYADTRANIVAGATVEIDYIIFGSSKANLNSYTSYNQDAYNESVSISESISKSESEAAAATATTAAA